METDEKKEQHSGFVSFSSPSSCSAKVAPPDWSPERRITGPLHCLGWLDNGGAGAVASCSFNVERLRFVDNAGSEWKNVEERFHRVATTTYGREFVVKWSDLGTCIGMKESPEFAKELLRALRGGRKWKFDIMKDELHKHWCRMTDPCLNSRTQLFFDMCDGDMDGRVTKMDVKQLILLSASTKQVIS